MSNDFKVLPTVNSTPVSVEGHSHAWGAITDKPATGTMFFHDDPSDIATYEKILETQAFGAEEDDTIALTSAGGEVIFSKYISGSAAGWGVTLIPAGLWEFHVFSYVSSISGSTTTIKLSVYKRTIAGAETLLFAVSQVVIATAVTMHEIISSQPEFNILATDRLVVKVSGITTSTPARTLHFVHEGTAHDSNFEFPTLSGNSETPEEILTKLLTVDGTGTGLDADLLDGSHAAAFATSAHTHTEMSAADILTAIKTVDGTGSGLDADLLDGAHGAAYALLNSAPIFTGIVEGDYFTSDRGTTAGKGYFTEAHADLGSGRTADGSVYVDLFAVNAAAAYNARIIRNTGVNGTLDIFNTGTGAIRIDSRNTGYIEFYTSNVKVWEIGDSVEAGGAYLKGTGNVAQIVLDITTGGGLAVYNGATALSTFSTTAGSSVIVGSVSGLPTKLIQNNESRIILDAASRIQIVNDSDGVARIQPETAFTLANNAIQNLGTGMNFLFIMCSSEISMAVYVLYGSSHAVYEVSDPSNVYSVTKGTASSHNIYWDAGAAQYQIENKRGASRSYWVFSVART